MPAPPPSPTPCNLPTEVILYLKEHVLHFLEETEGPAMCWGNRWAEQVEGRRGRRKKLGRREKGKGGQGHSTSSLSCNKSADKYNVCCLLKSMVSNSSRHLLITYDRCGILI